MMRSLWMVISTLALANLLALVGFVGWLAATDRLNMDRIEHLREVFSETISEEQARLEREERERELREQAEEDEQRMRIPPVASTDRLQMQSEFDLVMQQQRERTRRTLDDMRRSLEAERTQLDADIARFQAERQAFREMRRRIEEIEGDEQFTKALTLYSSMQPKDAANALRQLHQRGDVEQVVAYLNAMEPRKASKVLTQFDPAMAADLLERLRMWGFVASAPEER